MAANIHFKATRRAGFTLIEIMIVVAILGIILAIAGTTWVRQRERSQQRACQENLAKIDGAKESWAMELGKPGSTAVGWDDLVPVAGTGYLRKQPNCPGGGNYTLATVNDAVTCSILEPYDHNDRTANSPRKN